MIACLIVALERFQPDRIGLSAPRPLFDRHFQGNR